MELRHLTYAVGVARAGSISRAAEEMRLSQPSLSAAIAQLEIELGAKLFERSTRGVTLTPVGAYVVRQAQRLLRDTDEMRSTVRSMVAGAAGVLSIGVAPVLAWQLGPQIMKRFAESHPDVQLELRERNAGEVIELLIERRIDVGLIATASFTHLRDFHLGSFEVEKLGAVELVAALPARYQNAPDPIPISTFADAEIALPPVSARTIGLRAEVLRAFDRANLPSPRVRDVPSLFEALPLALAGIAVALVPEGMLAARNAEGLVVRRMIDGPAPLDVSLLSRTDPQTMANVRGFARAAHEVADETDIIEVE